MPKRTAALSALPPFRRQPEHLGGAVVTHAQWPPHEVHLLEFRNRDGSPYRQIRAGAGRQFAVELDVHGHAVLGYRRIHAGDPSRDIVIKDGDGCPLPLDHTTGIGLRYPDHGAQGFAERAQAPPAAPPEDTAGGSGRREFGSVVRRLEGPRSAAGPLRGLGPRGGGGGPADMAAVEGLAADRARGSCGGAREVISRPAAVVAASMATESCTHGPAAAS